MRHVMLPILCLCSIFAWGQNSKATIEQNEQKIAEALGRQDWKAIHAFESSDYQIVDADGNWLKSKEAQKTEEGFKVTSTISDMDVRVYGNTGVAVFVNNIKGTYNDKDISGTAVETDSLGQIAQRLEASLCTGDE